MARVIVASPDTALLDMLESMLAGLGHETIRAVDGQEALSAAGVADPDIVFLDVSLPVFDGFETCALLRSEPALPATLPVLLLTSLEGGTRQLHKVGATAFVKKTLSASALSDLLAKHLSPEGF